jgi:DNA mismatch repair protein MutS2
VTAASIDASLARAEAIAERLPPAPAAGREAELEPREPRRWRVGDRARSRSGGWEGRVAALERGGRRATLEAGGMKVIVELTDLVPAVASADDRTTRRADTGAPAADSSTNAAALRLARARTVASSLDLRGARVDEALDALARYLDDAGLAGLSAVTIIHGLGTGALRDAVRTAAADHPLVRDVRAGERGEGGDGATIVSL